MEPTNANSGGDYHQTVNVHGTEHLLNFLKVRRSQKFKVEMKVRRVS